MASTVRRPSTIPEIPALRILLKFIPAPRAKAVKGREKNHAGGQNFSPLMVQIADDEPDNHGDDAGNDICYGKLPMPEAPNAIMVKKGPSLRARIEVAPHLFHRQIRLPGGIDDAVGIGYGSDDSQGASPRNPASPNSALSRSPRPKPIKNLRAVRTTPFHTKLPHPYINGGAAAEQETGQSGWGPRSEQA